MQGRIYLRTCQGLGGDGPVCSVCCLLPNIEKPLVRFIFSSSLDVNQVETFQLPRRERERETYDVFPRVLCCWRPKQEKVASRFFKCIFEPVIYCLFCLFFLSRKVNGHREGLGVPSSKIRVRFKTTARKRSISTYVARCWAKRHKHAS